MGRSAWLLGAVWALGCGEAAPLAPARALAPEPLDLSRGDLLYRYQDPGSGEMRTAVRQADVPESARARVLVVDPAAPSPAGWEQLADLRGAAPQRSTPVPAEDVAMAPRARAPLGAAGAPSPRATAGAPNPRATAGAHQVSLFSSRGCGYCAKARAWLAQRKVPYTEYDVERDARAGAKLAELGQRAGVQPGQLQGVPILFVDDQVVQGWDPGRMAQLLR